MLFFSKLVPLASVMLILATAAPGLAQRAKYNESYTIQGFSQPYRFAEVASPIAGIVSSIETNEGELVTEGQCLVELDSKVQQGRVEVARVAMESLGELANANAQLAADTTRLRRIMELAERNHASAVEVLQARENRAIAKATVLRAEDRLAQQAAEYRRLLAEAEQYCIKAPFDGVVVEYVKDRGEYVGPGDSTVCTIADLSKLRVEFLVPRNFRHNLRTGSQVNILFTVAGKVVPGKVQYISPFPNGETNTFTVKMIVDNSDGELSAGERCQIQGLNVTTTSSKSSQGT